MLNRNYCRLFCRAPRSSLKMNHLHLGRQVHNSIAEADMIPEVHKLGSIAMFPSLVYAPEALEVTVVIVRLVWKYDNDRLRTKRMR
jgi:hypothetical protein